MVLEEEVQIPLDRETVFHALNDPEILKQSIPGCEELKQHSKTKMEAIVVVKFGPVKASFNSNVETDPSAGPALFKLTGTGDAGVAGFASGGADVHLTENADGTLLRYVVNLDVNGKLVQMGGWLVEKTTIRVVKKFFSNFEEALQQRQT